MSMDIGIVGTECGATIFINLLNGQQLGITYINESISDLHICQNEYSEIASLLITSKFQQQWRLPLDHMSFNLLHNFVNKEPYNELNSNDTIHDNNVGNSIPNKSKLQELKQLSVEKLAIFKQKLIDTKNQTLGESLQCHGRYTNVFRKISDVTLSISQKKSNEAFVLFLFHINITDGASIEENSNGISVNLEVPESKLRFVSPEPVSKDIFLSLQYDRENRQLYTCYHPVANYITVRSLCNISL